MLFSHAVTERVSVYITCRYTSLTFLFVYLCAKECVFTGLISLLCAGSLVGVFLSLSLSLVRSLGVTYAYVRHQVRKHSDDWQGNYRPNLEEEKAMLRKHVQPLLYVRSREET